MQADDLEARRKQMEVVADRINAGAEISSVDPSRIGHMWEMMSSIPREQNSTTGLGAVAGGDPSAEHVDIEEQFAVAIRCKILQAVVDRGVLDEFMKDEAGRKKVFAAAATFKCNKNDFGEVLAQESIRNSPPDSREKMREELRSAGCDPDNPVIVEKFLSWIR